MKTETKIKEKSLIQSKLSVQ